MAMNAVHIPVRSDVLVLEPHQIDENILGILETENAPIKSYLDVSKVLLAKGRTDAFVKCLDQAIKSSQQGDQRFHKIQAMCTLASYYIEQAKLARDDLARSNFISNARNLALDAGKLDQYELLPKLIMGELFRVSDIEKDTTYIQARNMFENAANARVNGKASIAGILALAGLLLQKGDVRPALAQYRRALKTLPSAPPEVRLGIAVCHFRLGEAGPAEAAFKRVLELDPNCTQALLGLAALKLVVGADAESVKEGSQLLARAFHLDPDSPRTLSVLAKFSLRQGYADAAKRLAQAAVDRADGDDKALLAEALTTLGRAFHANGQVRDASIAYRKAADLNRKLPLPRLGLVLFHLLSGHDAASAAGQLEELLKDVPAWIDALKVLGTIATRAEPGMKLSHTAIGHFKEAASRNSDNPMIWELLGDVLAIVEPAAALAAYQKSIDLHKKKTKNGTNGQVPARLYNNAAVLLLQSGETSKARAHVQEAIRSAAAGGLDDLGTFAQVTLGYNSARLLEAIGDVGAAEKEYRALADQFPQYADCQLRLACIAKARGDLPGAESWAQKAADISNRSADALALLSSIYLESGDTDAAKKVLDELQLSLPPTESTLETFAKVALGNIHLSSVPSDRRKEESRRRAETQLTNAKKVFTKALKIDPGNVYAANGLGCVLAEAGRLQEAKQVFQEVQSAVAATSGFFRMPDPLVNLANVFLGLGEYDNAAQAYTNALKRFYDNRNDRVLLYLARTKYDASKEDGNNSTKLFQDALRVLSRALHLRPGDSRLRFNLAYLLSEAGTRELARERPANDPNKVADFNKAVNDLLLAHRLFESLQQAGKEVTRLDERRLDAHIQHCAKVYNDGLSYLKVAEQEAAVLNARWEEQRLKQEAAAKLKEVEERRKAAEEEAAAKARAVASVAHAERVERLKKDLKDNAKLRKAAEAGDIGEMIGKKGKPTADDALDALFAVDDDEEDMEYQPGQESGDDGAAAPADAAAGGEEVGTAALLMGGDASDDDEDFDFGGEQESEPEAEAPKADKSPKKKGSPAKKKATPAKKKSTGRLKKRGREEPTETAAEEPTGLEDDAVAAEENGGEGKRPRKVIEDIFGSDSE